MNTNSEDKLLFKQIKKGNQEAFDTLFKKYYERLVQFSIGYLKSGQLAEEVVQDVFIKLWEYAKRINIESSLLSYLYTSSRNACINHIKSENIRTKHQKEKHASEQKEETGSGSEINIAGFQNLLSTQVALLPDKCRCIFEMSKYEGLSYDEIAEYLGISSKTVENQMGIALKKLRESLSPFKNLIYE